MKKQIAACFLMMLIALSIGAQPFKSYKPAGGISIGFYKNVEFLGFVFFLGSQYMGELYEKDESLNHMGIKKKDWFGWDLSLYHQYKSFKGNQDHATATRFAEAMEGSALMRLMIRLADFPNAAVTKELEFDAYSMFADSKDSSEARKNVTLFIESLNRFYTTTRFDNYFFQNKQLYEQAMQEVKSVLPSKEFLPSIEKFYRSKFDGYGLLPSLTIPSGMAFGVSDKKKNRHFIFNAFGPFAVQQFSSKPYNLGFADEQHIRELSVHEFGHSFVNPQLDRIPAEVFNETASLYDTIKTAMDNQGYNNWTTCLIEHFVRAGEVVIAENMGFTESAKKLEQEYINNRKFIYLPLIIKELQLYNTNKNLSYQEVIKSVLEKLGRLKKGDK